MFARALPAICTAALLLCFAGGASADVNGQRLDATIRFLQDVQNDDGGFGGRRGSESDIGFTAWVGIALASAGINPKDQSKSTTATDLHTYLVDRKEQLRYTTDFERTALVAVAAGTDLHDFGGLDLVDKILSRQLPSGAFAHEAFPPGTESGAGINDTIFAVLALGQERDDNTRAAVRRGIEWLLSRQSADGSWDFATSAASGSVDITGAALQALHAADRTGTDPERHAWEYLHELQNEDGGFGQGAYDRSSNTASTAWALQAIWAAGDSPSAWSPNGSEPRDFLATMQQPDGSIRWRADQNVNPVWMTAYAAPAFAGRPLPLSAVPRKAKTEQPTEPTKQSLASPISTNPGNGGSQKRSSGGKVIAGGGGRGADLFSKPQPQSKGNKAGGKRNTTDAAAPDAPEVDASAQAETFASTDAKSQAKSSSDKRDGTSSGDLITGRAIDSPLVAAKTAAAPGLAAAKEGEAGSNLIAALLLFSLALALLAGVLREQQISKANR